MDGGALGDERLVARGTDADEGDAGAGEFGEAIEVGFGEIREVLVVADGAEVLFPALMLFVDGFALLDVGDGGGRVVDDFAVEAVGGADLDGVEAVEAVEVGDGEFIGAVDHDGVADEDHVEPAAAAGATGGGAEFAAHVVEHVADGFVFGGEGAGADTGRVGFGDGDDVVDHPRRDAGAGAGAAGGGVGRGDEGVAAVIDVEVGALGAFEEEFFAGLDGFVEADGGVGDVGGQDGGGGEDFGDGFVRGDFVDTDITEGDVVFGDAVAEFFLEFGGAGEEDGADAGAFDFIGISGTDAAAGGADFFVAAFDFAGEVEGAVVG